MRGQLVGINYPFDLMKHFPQQIAVQWLFLCHYLQRISQPRFYKLINMPPANLD